MLASIKLGCCFLLSDVYSFNSPSLCVVCLTCFTVAASQTTLCCVLHACTAILFFVSFLLIAPLCFLQRSSSFSNVHAFTFSTGYLLHNSSFLPRWLWLLCLYQDFAECSSRLHLTSTIDLVHSAISSSCMQYVQFRTTQQAPPFTQHLCINIVHRSTLWLELALYRHCGWCTT